jgi:hypothetical protein
MSNAKFTNPTRARLIIGYGATPVSKLRRAAAELRAILPAPYRPEGPRAGPVAAG